MFSGMALGGKIENLATSPAYIFLVCVSVVLFLILAFNYIKNLRNWHDSFENMGVLFLVTGVLNLWNIIAIIVLLSVEIAFLFDAEVSAFLNSLKS